MKIKKDEMVAIDSFVRAIWYRDKSLVAYDECLCEDYQIVIDDSRTLLMFDGFRVVMNMLGNPSMLDYHTYLNQMFIQELNRLIGRVDYVTSRTPDEKFDSFVAELQSMNSLIKVRRK